MDLPTIQSDWDQAAREDALFNILTVPGRANHGWTIEEFYAHGQTEIDQAIQHLDNLGVRHGNTRALDFGCGAGRLTQALTHHYRNVDGVDISPQMIQLAKQHNPGRCTYHHNTAPHLRLFKTGTFDLVYSMIVLQHMPSPLQHGYIAEFLRIIKPNGIAMFEIPDGPNHHANERWLSMHGTPKDDVHRTVQQNGGQIIDVELIDEPSQWNCYRYTATRQEQGSGAAGQRGRGRVANPNATTRRPPGGSLQRRLDFLEGLGGLDGCDA